MKLSIKEKFLDISERKPYWSSYICYAETIRGSKLDRASIEEGLVALVERGDYIGCGRTAILDNLEALAYNKVLG